MEKALPRRKRLSVRDQIIEYDANDGKIWIAKLAYWLSGDTHHEFNGV